MTDSDYPLYQKMLDDAHASVESKRIEIRMLHAQLEALERRHADHLAAWQANRETLAKAAREVVECYDYKRGPSPGGFARAIDRLRELVRTESQPQRFTGTYDPTNTGEL